MDLASTVDWNCFSKVSICSQALLKMVAHARDGGEIEGQVVQNVFHISDCFRLPVEGTETRVNAGAEAMEFMVEYTEMNERTEFSSDPVCGWYHSHPGYGCWLSGIDIATQSLYQQHQDPFVAIVIDPLRTLETGLVDIGAFRTYPEGSGVRTPSDKCLKTSSKAVQPFGVHSDRYYSLEVVFDVTDCDRELARRYWVSNWTEVLKSSTSDTAMKSIATGLHKMAHNIQEESMKEVEDDVRRTACAHIHHIAKSIVTRSVLRGSKQ